MLNFFINKSLFNVFSISFKKSLLFVFQIDYFKRKFIKVEWVDVFFKFKKNYKYFFFFKYLNTNYCFTACTKRRLKKNVKKLKLEKKKLNFTDFLDLGFQKFTNSLLTKKTVIVFSNFLIFFFKNFINFFKKYIIDLEPVNYIIFYFYSHKYKFKKFKTCKKNMQKKIFLNSRKKNNFLNF